MDDYYKILGIERNADENTIKSAYRKLAFQFHPDRNLGNKEAEDMFKKVNLAYETLYDPLKKSAYDNQFSNPFISVNPLHDLFTSIFTQRPKQQNWGQHIEGEIVINFIESVKGCMKEFTFNKREICKFCNGTTAKDGKEFSDCVICEGKGRVFNQHYTNNTFIRTDTMCRFCKGTGKVIVTPCKHCDGQGYTSQPCTLNIKIPVGISDGMKLCIRGEGDIGLSGSGNLFCVVRVTPHPIFTRDGVNLCIKLPIAYTQAVFGGEIDVPCLDGTCKLKIPSGIQSGAIFRIPEMGFSLPEQEDAMKGDLLVKIIVDIPDGVALPEEYQEVLKKIAVMENDNLGSSRKNFKRNLEESVL